MSTLIDFLDDVLPDVPGAGIALVKHAILTACMEFCRETLIYKHEPAAMHIVAGTRDYALTLPAGTQVADVLRVAVSGDPIYPKSDTELDALLAVDWRSIAVTGEVAYYKLTGADRSTLRLVLTPSASVTAGLTTELALEPSLAATTVPDWLLSRHRLGIAHGAKATLFAMQKKPWSDPQRAIYHGQQFGIAKGAADASAAKSHTRTRLRVACHFK